VHDLPEGESVYECDAVGRVVVHDGIELEVPPAGAMVSTEVLYVDGAEQFSIQVDKFGIVEYTADPDDAAVADANSRNGDFSGLITDDTRWDAEGTRLPPDCDGTAYHDKDEEQASVHDWYMGDGVRPNGMTTDEARSALRDAMQNITGSDNNCNLEDQVDAQAGYRGVHPYESDLVFEGGESKCGDRDGVSTVDFGNLDNNGDPPLATECTWVFPQPFANNNILESDVRFNTTEFLWTNNPAGMGCNNVYDLRSIATHEFGHSFGLGHVLERYHPLQTMSEFADPCDASQRSLGRGDVYGLRNTY
jgi:hypothetical protein